MGVMGIMGNMGVMGTILHSSFFILHSSVYEPDFSHGVPAQQTALVYVSVDASDVSLAGVLPCKDVAPVYQYGFRVAVFGYHELVGRELAGQVLVVEVLT
jgi:hypothetical protein